VVFAWGYHKRSDSFEIVKLKGPQTCVSTFVKKDHYQLDTNFIDNATSTLIMNKLSIKVANIQDKIKLH
jgi:hypothetical protein